MKHSRPQVASPPLAAAPSTSAPTAPAPIAARSRLGSGRDGALPPLLRNPALASLLLASLLGGLTIACGGATEGQEGKTTDEDRNSKADAGSPFADAGKPSTGQSSADESSADDTSDDAPPKATMPTGVPSEDTAGMGGTNSSGGPAIPGYPDPPQSIDVPIDVPDNCKAVFSNVTTSYCESHVECDVSFSDTHCFETTRPDAEGKADWNCDCIGSTGVGSFIVSSTTAEDLCPAVIQMCAAGELPEPVDAETEPTCAPEYKSSSQESCSYQLDCKQSASIGDLEVDVGQAKVANCNLASGDQWNCSCYDGNGGSGFVIDDVGDPFDLCTEVRDLCDTETIEPTGDITCRPRQVVAEDNFCFGAISCEQQATLGDRDVLAAGEGSVNCELVRDELQCVCYGGAEEIKLSLPQGDDVWSSCNEAVQMCSEAIAESGELAAGGGGQMSGPIMGGPPPPPIPFAATASAAPSGGVRTNR